MDAVYRSVNVFPTVGENAPLSFRDYPSNPELFNLGRVVRREQSSSIVIELTFALLKSIKGNTNYYIWSKQVDFHLSDR